MNGSSGFGCLLNVSRPTCVGGLLVVELLSLHSLHSTLCEYVFLDALLVRVAEILLFLLPHPIQPDFITRFFHLLLLLAHGGRTSNAGTCSSLWGEFSRSTATVKLTLCLEVIGCSWAISSIAFEFKMRLTNSISNTEWSKPDQIAGVVNRCASQSSGNLDSPVTRNASTN